MASAIKPTTCGLSRGQSGAVHLASGLTRWLMGSSGPAARAVPLIFISPPIPLPEEPHGGVGPANAARRQRSGIDDLIGAEDRNLILLRLLLFAPRLPLLVALPFLLELFELLVVLLLAELDRFAGPFDGFFELA